MLWCADDRHTCLDDAGFFPGDRCQSMPEQIDMIVADRGDGADSRADYVRGVEASTQPHLDHCQIDARFGKIQEGEGGGDFESRDAGRRLDGSLAERSTSFTRASSGMRSPCTLIRSRKVCRCGDV